MNLPSASFLRRALVLLATAGATGLAGAHTGADAGAHHGLGFVDGLGHPFTGLDHLAAMLAVGAWSAVALKGRQMLAAPAAFAAMLLLGAVLARNGAVLPVAEPMVAASLLVLGLLLAARSPLPAAVAAFIAGGFALFHGAAHGVELAEAASPAAAMAGMLLGTVVLHLAGIGIGRMLAARGAWLSQAAGALVCALGLALLAAPAAAQLLH